MPEFVALALHKECEQSPLSVFSSTHTLGVQSNAHVPGSKSYWTPWNLFLSIHSQVCALNQELTGKEI